VRPFVFEEHVLPLEGELLERFVDTGMVSRVLSRVSRKAHIARKQDVDCLRRGYLAWWRATSKFFNKINEGKYCNCEYFSPQKNLEWLDHILKISGKKLEEFTICDIPSFEITPNGEKKTVIPIEKNGDQFDLFLFDHPQSREIPVYGRLELDYKFDLEISLGGLTSITRNVKNRAETHFGEPGKIYFRLGDKFYSEITEKVLGSLKTKHNRRGIYRPNFYMQGVISINGEFLYQGQIDSNGTFPFFLKRDPEGDRGERTTPRKPVGVAL